MILHPIPLCGFSPKPNNSLIPAGYPTTELNSNYPSVLLTNWL